MPHGLTGSRHAWATLAACLVLPGVTLAADRPPVGAGAPIVVARIAGCGAYGHYDCQFVPHISGDDRLGPVYAGGPRCVRRATPLGVRRLCRAF